jgi:FKBP-type peptidyl-prolyl cis-trans isomerase FkpA
MKVISLLKPVSVIVPQAFAALLVVGTLTACQPQSAGAVKETATVDAGATANSEVSDMGTIDSLQITDTAVGDGATAVAGRDIVVHYTGWLYDPEQADNKGSKFDSSVDRDQPFVFPLGAGRVIQGWDQGFDGMQVGGKRTLVIPPDMGYGARGAGADIPPNATLVFEVELLDIR